MKIPIDAYYHARDRFHTVSQLEREYNRAKLDDNGMARIPGDHPAKQVGDYFGAWEMWFSQKDMISMTSTSTR